MSQWLTMPGLRGAFNDKIEALCDWQKTAFEEHMGSIHTLFAENLELLHSENTKLKELLAISSSTHHLTTEASVSTIAEDSSTLRAAGILEASDDTSYVEAELSPMDVNANLFNAALDEALSIETQEMSANTHKIQGVKKEDLASVKLLRHSEQEAEGQRVNNEAQEKPNEESIRTESVRPVRFASGQSSTYQDTGNAKECLQENSLSASLTKKLGTRSDSLFSKTCECMAAQLIPVQRWGVVVGKMLLPVSRLQRMAVPDEWHLHPSWLAAKRGPNSEKSAMIEWVTAAFQSLDTGEFAEAGNSIRKSSSRKQNSRGRGYLKSLVWFSIERFVSLLKSIWNLLRLLFVLYDTIMTPVLIFLTDDLEFAKATSWTSRIFWTLDVGINLMPKCRSAGNTPFWGPPLQYLKGWFGFDFVILLSDWLFLLSDTWLRSPGAFLRVVNIRKVLYARTVRQQIGADYDARSIVIYILEAILTFAITIHVWACAWYSVGNATNDGWAQEPTLQSSRVIHKYFISLGWAASQIHGASLGDSFFMNTVELAFSALSIIIGYILFLFFVGRVANVEAIRFRKYQNTDTKMCLNFCRQNSISPELHVRALRYFRNNDKKRRLIQHVQNEEEFLSLLPKSLRMDMKEQMLGLLCMNIEFFNASDSIGSPLVRKVCDDAASIMPCFTDEVVFDEGDNCSNAYIVQSGGFCYKMGRDWNKGGTPKSHVVGTHVFSTMQSWSQGLDSNDCRNLDEGCPVSEAVLWTKWIHFGKLFATSRATLLLLNADEVIKIALEQKGSIIASVSCHYATRFVSQLNEAAVQSDLFCYRVFSDANWRDFSEIECSDRHFAFLSHFKAEAGTEATLIHAELNQMISEQASHPANKLLSPVFLDSSDLNDLKQLRKHAENSRNLILLLTPGVLSRPWCLVEICVAVLNDNCIIPVEVQRPGLPSFEYPREEFYQKLRSGALLGLESMDLLKEEGFEPTTVEAAVRRVFMRIALPFSPHKSHAVRHAELSDIFARCPFD